MTEDERRGREWCERNGKRPYRPGTYSHWYRESKKADWSTLPPVMYYAARLYCDGRSSTYISFETEADAYAAVGRAIAEMEAVVGE